MPFELRSYQTPLVDEAEALMLSGLVPCVVAPTGAGKTVLLAETARRALARGERVVAVCHRLEIVEQLVDSLRRHLGQWLDLEVVRSGSRSRLASRVVVGMVPTMARRLGHLGALRGCTLLQDECHHAGATSWQNVTAAIQPARRCGFTATPIRPDGRGLGDDGSFDQLILGPQPGELMDLGALCRYRLYAAAGYDTEGLRRKRTGDFVTADMEAKVVSISGDIVRDWRRFNPQALRTIAVGVSVDHAHTLAKLYREEGIPAETVDGKTPAALRRAIFGRFRDGTTTVLCACAVIDEGLDVPEATVLQVTRPTESLRLWRQLVGRVLRPAAEKSHAIIIDHTDNWKRLPPPDAPIEWELTSRRIEVALTPLEADPVTGEVREAEQLEVELPAAPAEQVVIGDGQALVEVTAEMLANNSPAMARRLLNERLAADLAAVRFGQMPAEVLRPWLDRTAILGDDLLHQLGEALGMPQGWAAGQAMLNLLQSPKQLKEATKRLQKGAQGQGWR